jgi:phosphoribosyl-ATP pyrophosphohydrolase/phosphoribosyl-AMP cyclohydrolase
VNLAWNDQGLVPAVAQDATSGAVLMVAWMNADALRLTRETGLAHFYSRSRQAMWQKGETSGNLLRVRELRIDCDADTILLLVDPTGPACHTGKPNCFFRPLDRDGEAAPEDDGGPGAPAAVLDRVAAVLAARKASSSAEKSYTKSLLEGGFPTILAKIAEEHGELADELPAGDEAAVVHETADLLFHVLVGLTARDIPVERVWAELGRRFGTGGHVEKAARAKPSS